MDLQKLKRLNLRQPKYIFPLVIFLPLLGLIYFGMQTFKGNGKTAKNIVTDSINMSLPEARSEGMDDKMTAMNKRFSEGGAFTAVDGIGDEYEQKDTTGSGYNDKERQDINAVNAERLRQMKAEQDLRERQQANMNRINGYGRGGYGSSGRSQQEDLNAYARELDRIQNCSMERQRQYQAEQDRRDKEEDRMKHVRVNNANIEPVFFAYPDKHEHKHLRLFQYFYVLTFLSPQAELCPFQKAKRNANALNRVFEYAQFHCFSTLALFHVPYNIL